MISKIWKKKYFDALARFLIRHAVGLMLLGVALTILSFYYASRLTIDSDYMAFLPEDFPGVQNLKKVIQKTGSFGNFMVVIEGGSLEGRRKFAGEFAQRAERFSWVDYAEYQKNWEKIEKSKFLYLSLEDLQTIYDRLDQTISIKKSSKNPFAISLLSEEEEKKLELDFSDIERKYQLTSFGTPYFEDPELRYTVTLVWPKGSMTNLDFAEKAYADLKSLIAEINPQAFDPGLEVDIGGEFRTKIDEYHALRKNLLGSSLVTVLAICLLLYIFYRKIGAVFYTLLPLLLGTSWNFGLAYLLVGRLNLLTVFLVAILFGLGIDFGIYLFSHYMELRASKKSLEKTIAAVLYDTGRASFSAAITTAIAFLTLMFMDFKGYQEFGLLISVGIFALFAAFFIYSPVIWILAEKFKLIHPEKLKTPRLWIRKPPISKHVVYLACGLSVLGLLALPFVSFEYDYGNLRSRSSTYWDLGPKIHAVFPLSKTPAIVLTDTLDETKEVVQAVLKKIPQVTTIDTVKSVLDFLPEQIEQKKEVIHQIKEIILKNLSHMTSDEKEKVNRYMPYLSPDKIRLEDLPRSLVRQFNGLPGTPGYMVFIYDKVRLSDARNAIQYANDIREIKTEHKTYHAAEGSLLFADAISMMKKEAAVAFLAILLGVYLVVAWDFGSFKRAVVVFLPLIVGIIMTLGIMSLFRLKLNIFNLVNFPILVCLGIDTSIHLYHRFLQGENDESFTQMILSTGNSVVLAMTTTMIGFGSMIFTDHQGLKSTGIVAVIGLTCNVISSLIFFPAFLKWRMGK